MMTFVKISLKPSIASISARWDDVVPIGGIGRAETVRLLETVRHAVVVAVDRR